jgi:hypothetical protein
VPSLEGAIFQNHRFQLTSKYHSFSGRECVIANQFLTPTPRCISISSKTGVRSWPHRWTSKSVER